VTRTWTWVCAECGACGIALSEEAANAALSGHGMLAVLVTGGVRCPGPQGTEAAAGNPARTRSSALTPRAWRRALPGEV